MKIKSSARVRYSQNPLVEVLCQIRFHRLLALETEAPAELQDKFAEAGYPILTVDRQPTIQINWSALGVGDAVHHDPGSAPSPDVYHFASLDGVRKISLHSEFIAFSCQKYEDWPHFRSGLDEVIELFLGRYPHAAPVRVGLRYKDLVSREELGLAGVPWNELLEPLVGGVFNATDYFEDGRLDETKVSHQATQIGLELDDCELLLQTALLKSADGSGSQAFLIDTDFYQESPTYELSFAKMDQSLRSLHNSAGAIFRHCIKEKLHHALGPVEF